MNLKEPVPKVIGISKEWEDKFEMTRKYLGNGNYKKEKGDRSYIGDKTYLNKPYPERIAIKLSIENKNY